MTRKKATRPEPGETGVSGEGIPWRVPTIRPGAGERLRRWLSLASVTVPDETMPAGAEFVPARTPEEVLRRCTRRYGEGIAELLQDDESLAGFTDFGFDQHVPRPPQPGLEPPKKAAEWWMGGDWDSAAGQLVTSVDAVIPKNRKAMSVLYRGLLWVRTSRRVLILAGNMETPAATGGEYPLEEIGLRPGWEPGDSYRVDIAFSDGSWLGVIGLTTRVPGGTEGYPDRDLLAQLADPSRQT